MSLKVHILTIKTGVGFLVAFICLIILVYIILIIQMTKVMGVYYSIYIVNS